MPNRPSRQAMAEARETAAAAETARAESRAQWIDDNPEAHAAEHAALAAAQQERIALETG